MLKARSHIFRLSRSMLSDIPIVHDSKSPWRTEIILKTRVLLKKIPSKCFPGIFLRYSTKILKYFFSCLKFSYTKKQIVYSIMQNEAWCTYFFNWQKQKKMLKFNFLIFVCFPFYPCCSGFIIFDIEEFKIKNFFVLKFFYGISYFS